MELANDASRSAFPWRMRGPSISSGSVMGKERVRSAEYDEKRIFLAGMDTMICQFGLWKYLAKLFAVVFWNSTSWTRAAPRVGLSPQCA